MENRPGVVGLTRMFLEKIVPLEAVSFKVPGPTATSLGITMFTCAGETRSN